MRTIIAAVLLVSITVSAQDKAIDPFAPVSGASKTVQPAPPREPEDLRPRPATLKLLGEPSLEKLVDSQLPAIRFIWIRTFHPPISVRAYMTKDGPRLRVARTSGKGGYEWGKLDFENDFALKPEIWQHIVDLLQADGAREPFKKVKPEDRDFLSGLDGATWKLEAVDQAGYTVDEAWSPTSFTDGKPEERKFAEDRGIRLDNFVRLCKYLIQYAPIDPESIY